jgi:hypothetical protein
MAKAIIEKTVYAKWENSESMFSKEAYVFWTVTFSILILIMAGLIVYLLIKLLELSNLRKEIQQ